MKKSSLLVSCAVAGLMLGSQAALADHHEEKGKETKDGKAACKSKDGKASCQTKDGKATCKTKDGKASCKTEVKDGSAGCGASGCQGKKEEKKQ